MRRTLIRSFLPLVFCAAPFVAAALIVIALPADARNFYLRRLHDSPMDWLILGLGTILFLVQMLLAWWSLRWRGTRFDERPDRWLSNLAQAAEWFPLLGLLGTVAGILQTFSNIGNSGQVVPEEVIRDYAPAITATGSGLLMAIINILPTWIVLVGRDFILSLGGGPSPTESLHAGAAYYTGSVAGSDRH